MRVERRATPLAAAPVVVPLASVLAAAVFGALFLLATGHDPLLVYSELAQAGLIAPGSLSATLVSSAPLLLTSLAAAAAFRVRLWNIGGEGQLYLGAIGAMGVGLLVGDRLGPLAIPAMALAGAAAGAAWALTPALLRAFLNVNEIISTLMLNYVAGLLLTYLIYDSSSYWRDLSSATARVFPQGKHLAAAAVWPAFNIPAGDLGLRLPLGFVLGLLLALGVWLLYRSTTIGFQARMVGSSPSAATYAGISVSRTIVLVICLSGALAGLAGASDAGDFRHVLDPAGMQVSGFGFGGIVVAALARSNYLAVAVVAVLIGALYSAGYSVSGSVLPGGLVGVLEGLLLFFVLAGTSLADYRLKFGCRLLAPGAAQHSEASANNA